MRSPKREDGSRDLYYKLPHIKKKQSLEKYAYFYVISLFFSFVPVWSTVFVQTFFKNWQTAAPSGRNVEIRHGHRQQRNYVGPRDRLEANNDANDAKDAKDEVLSLLAIFI